MTNFSPVYALYELWHSQFSHSRESGDEGHKSHQRVAVEND